jgi:hypothetical protein
LQALHSGDTCLQAITVYQSAPLLLLTCFFSLAFLNRHVCIQLIRQLVVAVALIALIEIRD